jgi:hypothetical protein
MAAVIAGTALVVSSKSGLAAVLVAAYIGLFWPKLRGAIRRVSSGGPFIAAFGVVLLAFLAFVAASRLAQRHPFSTNYSYAARSASIRAILDDVDAHPWSTAIGLGPGQSALHLRADIQGPAFARLPSAYVPTGVYSALVRFIAESGYLLGGFAVIGVIFGVSKAVRRSSEPSLGFFVLGTWFVGVAAATSYLELAPPWAILAVLLGWDWVAAPDAESESSVPR